MKASELIKKLQEGIELCGDGDVYLIDHPSEIGEMDAGCPVSLVRQADDGVYICMNNWGGTCMKFEDLQGKRVVFSGECVPLSIRTKAWQAGALICVTVDKETAVVITTNTEAAKSRRARELGIPVIPASKMI